MTDEEMLDVLHIQNKPIVLICDDISAINQLLTRYGQSFYNRRHGNMLWINSKTFLTQAISFINLASELGIEAITKKISVVVAKVFQYFSDKNSLFLFNDASANNIVLMQLSLFAPYSKNLKILITTHDKHWSFSKYSVFDIINVYDHSTEAISTSAFLYGSILSSNIDSDTTNVQNIQVYDSEEALTDIKNNWNTTQYLKRLETRIYSLDETIKIWPWMAKMIALNKNNDANVSTENVTVDQWKSDQEDKTVPGAKAEFDIPSQTP